MPVLDQRLQLFVGGVICPVLAQIGQHLAVGVHGLMNKIGPGVLVMTVAEPGAQTLDLEVAGIEKEPNHGLPVVRVAANVGHDDQARFWITLTKERNRSQKER